MAYNNQQQNQLAPKASNTDLRKWLLSDTAKRDLAAVTTGVMTGDRLANVLYLCVQKTPDLAKCTPASLMAACKTLALMGCEPDSVNGYLVPRFTKNGIVCVPIPSARGLMRMARANGVKNLNVGTVREGEDFHWGIKDGRFYMTHTPAVFDETARAPRGYYCTWEDADGILHGTCMSDIEVTSIMQRSDGGKKGVGPWKTDYNQMALKTIIKRAAKQWDLPYEAQQAMKEADTAEFEANEAKVMRDVTRRDTEMQEALDALPEPPAEPTEELPLDVETATPEPSYRD